MTSELKKYEDWTFISECSTPADIANLMIPGESPVCSYKTIRDVATFTNKRLILKDTQGLTGKKIEVFSIPYSSILMFSTENAGILDMNAEVELWTKLGGIKINLKRGAEVDKIGRILATYIL